MPVNPFPYTISLALLVRYKGRANDEFRYTTHPRNRGLARAILPR